MNPLLIIAVIILLVFVFFNYVIFLSLKKIFDRADSINKEINFSIVIAAKNESHNINSLMDSISELDYPKDNYEIIFVDDGSSDNTYEKTTLLGKGISSLKIYKAADKKYPGKKGALAFGISKAKNPFILITDADCLLPKNWMKYFAYKFTEGYDFVFGIAPFTKGQNFSSTLSCFENLRSSILTFAFAGLGLPYSAAARNFGFKKSSFEKISGYENTTETLSGDDDLLLREAVKNDLRIGIVSSGDAVVFSSTPKTIKEYLKQKSRHTKTSLHYLPKTQVTLGLWHLLNLIFLFSPLLMFANPLFIMPFIIKILTDVFIVKKFQRKFSYQFSLFNIFICQIVYEIFLIINFGGALIKKDS
jgi:poly-beta-1,6-N-acetyl-D-glucosamine synthase